MSSISGKNVFVGLSGGVDSSVSAALLSAKGGSASGGKNARYDVTGVFIRVWHEDADVRGYGRGLTLMDAAGGCQAADDRLDAMRVCAQLGIPFVELNLEKEYKREVVDYMIREYKAGRTPNPDVFCNRFIKFGGFYDFARKAGADFIATGHYARVEPLTINRSLLTREVKGQKSKVKSFGLLAGSDPQKDQSYFLWQIRKEQLPHILFPVGGMKKPEVRKLAKKFGLITADKKDSQGLCFVGKVDMKEFLAHYITPKKGKILLGADERRFGPQYQSEARYGARRGLTQIGETVIGEHDGAFFYTLGERFGFAAQTYAEHTRTDAEKDTPLSFPPLKRGDRGGWFVVAKDMKRNTITVSHKGPSGDLPHARTEVAITNCNWLVEPQVGKTYGARVRYRQPLQKARMYADTTQMDADKNQRTSASVSATIRVRFASPQIAVPGQSLVLYDGDICLGGGIIAD